MFTCTCIHRIGFLLLKILNANIIRKLDTSFGIDLVTKSTIKKQYIWLTLRNCTMILFIIYSKSCSLALFFVKYCYKFLCYRGLLHKRHTMPAFHGVDQTLIAHLLHQHVHQGHLHQPHHHLHVRFHHRLAICLRNHLHHHHLQYRQHLRHNHYVDNKYMLPVQSIRSQFLVKMLPFDVLNAFNIIMYWHRAAGFKVCDAVVVQWILPI